MPGIKLVQQNMKDIYLSETSVENMFIDEHMPAAPGEYVKVFLFGLMCSQNNIETDIATMASDLRMKEEAVKEAWSYWARCGLVRVSRNGESADSEDFSIEFLNQRQKYYGRSAEKKNAGQGAETVEAPKEEQEQKEYPGVPDVEDRMAQLMNIEIKSLYDEYENMTGRLMSPRERMKIDDCIGIYGIVPDVLSYAIRYCADIEKYSLDYIVKVALRWTEEGCRNISDVKEYIDRHSKRSACYGKVFRELGFNRLPNDSDRKIMDRWFDEMGFSIDEVVSACRSAGGLREPNLRYVDAVLQNRRLETGGINVDHGRASGYRNGRGTGQNGRSGRSGSEGESRSASVSRQVLSDYYEYLQEEAVRKREERREEAVREIPELSDILEREDALRNELLRTYFDPDAEDRKKELKKERIELETYKRELLRIGNFPEDQLEIRYKCGICKDTGTTKEGKICTCREARAEEAYKWNLTRTGKTQN